MIICFDIEPPTKALLDGMVSSGKYRDYSEAISVSVGNQALLESKGAGVPSFVVKSDQVGHAEDMSKGRAPSNPSTLKDVPRLPTDLGEYGMPPLFSALADPARIPLSTISLAHPVDKAEYLQTEWIFGQFNKLLPAKANCRALARLSDGTNGVELAKVGMQIAKDATKLAQHLIMLERRYLVDRDHRVSTAFPNGDDLKRSQERFSSQFVGSINKSDAVSGLLYSFRLIGRVANRPDLVALTLAGKEFASLASPLLDSRSDELGARFSPSEIDFLVSHIRTAVPEERYAYSLILDAVADGHDTPSTLASALADSEGSGDTHSPAFFSTQRSGAVSRMSDLGLLQKRREGIRVTYFLTEAGRDFLRSAG